MKRKKKCVKNETKNKRNCFEFESNYKSVKEVMNSLQTITQKCELFLMQFNIELNENQLNEYKAVFNKLKNRFKTDENVVQKAINERNNKIVAKTKRKTSSVESDNESIVSAEEVMSDRSCNDFDHHFNDSNVDVFQSDKQFMEDLESKIVVFYENDSKTGKREKRFRCGFDDCTVTSHSRANVLAHLAKHTNNRDFQCYWPLCEKSFGYKKSLISHIECFHLRKERFKCCCSGCGQTFVIKTKLQLHMKEQHSNEVNHICNWLECQLVVNNIQCLWPKCEQMFTTKKLLDTHIEDMHLKSSIEELGQKSTEEKLFKCDKSDCDFATNQEKHLNEHKSKHKSRYLSLNRRNKPISLNDDSEENFINKYTGKPLSRKRRTKNHPCTWPACELTFESPNAVRVHMRKHTGEKPYTCDWIDCGKTFRYGGALKLHKEMIHLKLKQFKCTFGDCNEAFISMKQLEVHKAEHTGIKKYQCDWPGCEWRTNHSQQLAIHRMRTHEGLKIKIRKYKVKNQSNPHSMYDFKGQLKKYSCDWPGCERRFRFTSNLEQHIRTHQKSESDSGIEKLKEQKSKKPKVIRTGPRSTKQIHEKIFKCEWPECTSKYTSKTMLTQHMNTHTGHKPFACNQCEQSFAYGSSLRKHIQLYHQSPEDIIERQFKCQYFGCNRSFDRSKSLVFHQKRVHERTNTACNDTNSEVSSMSQPLEPFIANTINHSNVIRFDRIKAFNDLRIQTQIPMNLETTVKRVTTTPRPTPPTPKPTASHSTIMAKKLLSNAMKKQTIVQNLHPIDSETIAKDLPIPCTHEGCWRRLKTEKALEWHLKKYHSKTLN